MWKELTLMVDFCIYIIVVVYEAYVGDGDDSVVLVVTFHGNDYVLVLLYVD